MATSNKLATSTRATIVEADRINSSVAIGGRTAGIVAALARLAEVTPPQSSLWLKGDTAMPLRRGILVEINSESRVSLEGLIQEGLISERDALIVRYIQNPAEFAGAERRAALLDALRARP
ncbi:hypothetical protein AKG08_25190 [Achromobacter piechaudii]|jgi:DNA-binding transcriptional regulator YdaS (Cro superfamily)|uniref:Uncharacterized protein n=1 Tax=Achromobacter piechaudii ATCC 43553 TaxID=742159 RepID=D4XHF9_9BURK|nr:hypothetical protein HMPREF0004_4906 [Achromobacter piechaudii ATCC 43553]KNY05675.1 hypothetical protein AKG08_25190 [Achromobacter piechaudii]